MQLSIYHILCKEEEVFVFGILQFELAVHQSEDSLISQELKTETI